MQYSRLPVSHPRGSRRNWEERLRLPTRLELYTHGLVERKIATCGFLVWDVGNNRLLIEHGRQVAEGKQATQILADHRALSMGLAWLIRQDLHRRRIVAHTDSDLVYDHLALGRPVLRDSLWGLVQEARGPLKRFPQLTLELIPLQDNHHAAQMAAAAYVAAQEERRRRRAAEVVGELYAGRPGLYWVGNRYQVDLEAGTCTCPDYKQMHTEEYPIRCKHLLAAAQLHHQERKKKP